MLEPGDIVGVRGHHTAYRPLPRGDDRVYLRPGQVYCVLAMVDWNDTGWWAMVSGDVGLAWVWSGWLSEPKDAG